MDQLFEYPFDSISIDKVIGDYVTMCIVCLG